jgi:NAD(P)-dependent dehydrogenase (short-subunit alcohol dehydrogenase family)
MIRLDGKVVLVSGGSRGIGAATVRRVVELGGEAVVHYGSNRAAAEELAQEVGEDKVLLCAANLLSAEETEALWDRAEAWKSRIHVLINNAGVYEENPLELDAGDWLAGWERSMRINLISAAQLCRRAVQHFRRHGGGILINVASRAGHRGDSINHLQYGASKAGMLALNRSIARNCARENILAYGIAPGFVLTDMVSGIVERQGLEKMAALYPTGRITTPDEVAAVAVFLASGIAPQTTGDTIDLSGAADVR